MAPSIRHHKNWQFLPTPILPDGIARLIIDAGRTVDSIDMEPSSLPSPMLRLYDRLYRLAKDF